MEERDHRYESDIEEARDSFWSQVGAEVVVMIVVGAIALIGLSFY